MLAVDRIDAFHGPAQALRGLSLSVGAGEIVCLLGRNGAGKTTTLRAIMGLNPPRAGTVTLDGVALHSLPSHEIPRRGVGYVPQGRRLFGELTVAENLEIGLMTRRSGPAVRERVLGLFPRLRDRLGQQAGTLSGGEQQMLALGRALCVEPRVLLLDEPTEGLQPSMIALIRDIVVRLRAEGVAILLVEQRVDAVLRIADRVTVVENGRDAGSFDAATLRADPGLLRDRLGV